MAGNSGGPWGGGGSSGGGGNRGNNGGGNNGGGGGGRRPEDPQIPEIDELVKKGQEQLRVLMGGRGGNGQGGGTGGGQGGGGSPLFTKGTVAIAAVVGVLFWGSQSFYSVKPEEQSVELFLGEYMDTGNPGLNFAPWPLVTKEILPVTREQTEDIGVGGAGSDAGLMLTGDENIVDIDFQVVWNINDPAKYFPIE